MENQSSRFTEQTTNCAPILANLEPSAEETALCELLRPQMRGSGQIQQVLGLGVHTFVSSSYLSEGASHQGELKLLKPNQGNPPCIAAIMDSKWEEALPSEWTVTIENFSAEIPVPVQTATNETLGYYGCSLLKQGDTIDLQHRSILVEFTYGNGYLDEYVDAVAGGSGIEHHGFAHVDTPLDENSGYLILGNLEVESGLLELTAFNVPQCHSVYIPGNTIHTNDYFLGRWQTLLSASCNFPSAKLRGVDNRRLRILPVRTDPALFSPCAGVTVHSQRNNWRWSPAELQKIAGSTETRNYVKTYP